MKILLTGASGFLGSHIADQLIDLKFEVLALKRQTSNIKLLPFSEKVKWLNIEDNWLAEATKFSPEIIIHTAWTGVNAEARNNWTEQLTNVLFVNQLLELARISHVNKFISLGSQAEYGDFSGKVDESYQVNPVSAYGAIKCVIQQNVQSFCDIHQIKWFWLRIFSIYGERESTKWLIPNTIVNMLRDVESLNFTLGKQKYAYLYVKDFTQAIAQIIASEEGKSGIYNISSDSAMELKEIILIIQNIIMPKTQLNFGFYPYRPNQSMHIEGSMEKFHQTFGYFPISDFKFKIKEVIKYYKNQLNETD